MGLDSLFYGLAYRFGKPRWDTGEPRPELQELVESRPPGRALDIGCGTGTNSVFLAGHGWQVVGVDFVPKAIEAARERARRAGVAPNFVVGDASRLRQASVDGTFDLLLDIGCYHSIPIERRDAYASEVAAVAGPGSDFYLAGIVDPPASWRLIGARGVSSDEVRTRFGRDFEIVQEQSDGKRFVMFHLVRRAIGPTEGRPSEQARVDRPYVIPGGHGSI